jgi:hypothetical protein
VGRWEGDTLVVESSGFTDRSWLDYDSGNGQRNAGRRLDLRQRTISRFQPRRAEARADVGDRLVSGTTIRFVADDRDVITHLVIRTVEGEDMAVRKR